MSTTPSGSPSSITLFCPHCGAGVGLQDVVCPKCGNVQPGHTPMADPLPTNYYVRPTDAPSGRYGGFWIRFLAMIIDGIVVGLIMSPFTFAFFVAVGLGAQHSAFDPNRPPSPAALAAIMVPVLMLSLISMVAKWLYEALMTCSSKQATLGKMVFGLKVTDLQGMRLSFLHATGRHFAKYVSSMTLLIGYIVAGFTERKQALHDFIAGTLVVRN